MRALATLRGWRVGAAVVVAGLVALAIAACGGGGGGGGNSSSSGGGSSGSTSVSFSAACGTANGSGNVQPIAVCGGANNQFPNMVMTSVTICVPGTATCQTIPNVQVDTGSTGLRLLASAVTIALPGLTSASTGDPYGECTSFADGFVWGPLAQADVKLAGETAAAQPVQLLADNGAGPAVPAACSVGNGPNETAASVLGANGLIGVGLFLKDCTGCDLGPVGQYFDCPTGGTCTNVAIPLASQVGNVVAAFAQDNNGVVLQLPAVTGGGAASVGGNLLFGIGTQANNGVGASAVTVATETVSGNYPGSFDVSFGGALLPNGFIDSGSTAYYFDDSAVTACPSSSIASGFYCPGSETAVSLVPIAPVITTAIGGAATPQLQYGNALYLFEYQSGASNLLAFNDIAGPWGSSTPDTFDFGVPFFFGRSVFVAFESHTAAGVAGPYFAYQSYP